MSAAGGRLHLQLDSSHQKKAGPWEDLKIWRDSSISRSFEGKGFASIPSKIWVGGCLRKVVIEGMACQLPSS